MAEELRVKQQRGWGGRATHFVFSDGSHGVQHFVKGGLGLTIPARSTISMRNSMLLLLSGLIRLILEGDSLMENAVGDVFVRVVIDTSIKILISIRESCHSADGYDGDCSQDVQPPTRRKLGPWKMIWTTPRQAMTFRPTLGCSLIFDEV